jgi:transposase-like protein
MIDFPITEPLDDSICLPWLERHLHPDGLSCPRCGSRERRLFRRQAHFPAYRCRGCEGYHTLLTGTVFAKTHQRPATLVPLLRGMARGEPTARLAREAGMPRKQLQTLRYRVQVSLDATTPTGVMRWAAFEADELDRNAGEKKHAPPRVHMSQAFIKALNAYEPLPLAFSLIVSAYP